MNGRRLKLGAILAGLVLSGLTLLAWTQQWFSIELIPDGSVAVGGDVAAPALAALALSGLALVAALAIAGPVFRVILGLLEAAIGTLVVVSAVLAIVDPVAASASAITAVTGVSGTASVIALVSTVAPTAWPFVALLAGALVVAGDAERESSAHLYMLRIAGADEARRDAIIQHLADAGIGVNVHYIPMAMLTLFRERGYKIGDYPKTYELYANEITLPLYNVLTEAAIAEVIAGVRAAVEDTA